MTEQLEKTAQAMVADNKGILAADESSGTIQKRFDSIGAECTEENRRDYREMLFRSTDAMTNYISGVILFDETLRQDAKDGTPMAKVISDTGAIPGIKVDTGAKDLALCPGEKITEGLDGLRERFAEYYDLGARFTKWRAVITIGDGIPSRTCIQANAHALARYAALAQEADIVPMVEPEVLMDGPHDMARCFEVTEAALQALYDELYAQNVHLEGTILKPNMIVPGTECKKQASTEEIAEQTVQCMKRAVPAAVPGLTFLSGGLSSEEVTEYLSAMNAMFDAPWKLSFSFGRGLQAAPLKAWGGKAENYAAAQAALAHRARMNSLAVAGQWNTELEQAA